MRPSHPRFTSAVSQILDVDLRRSGCLSVGRCLLKLTNGRELAKSTRDGLTSNEFAQLAFSMSTQHRSLAAHRMRLPSGTLIFAPDVTACEQNENPVHIQ